MNEDQEEELEAFLDTLSWEDPEPWEYAA